ncbi:MarR family transcriptional regulator [Streptomyces sp. NPDC006283]|uniref:MarR family transcriptional regulator n=1 Tax=Streptomyces sp. NPDC006283 TaxID=3156741 RepID=UPI0033A89B91
MADHVDLVLRQWGAQRPDLDVSPMAVIGRIARCHRRIDAELTRTFALHGLDRASFDVLATLRRSGPAHRLTPAGLMRSAMVTSGAITQRLDRLEARGLVTRTPSESDGRVVHVELTEEGLELVDRVLPDHLATENRVLSALTDAERRTLAGTLRGLLESLGDTVPDESLPDEAPLSENMFCENEPSPDTSRPSPSRPPGGRPVRIEYDGRGDDAASGTELERALAIARDIGRTAPDRPVVLTVHDVGRLAATSGELASLAARLRDQGVGLEILTGPLRGVHRPQDSGATLFGVLTEATRLDEASEGVRERAAEQRPRAARGGGRPKVIDDEMLALARSLRAGGMGVAEIAERLTIRSGKNAGQHPSVASLYRALAQDRDPQQH